jgi:ribA/ribD-fused uncharacterized protein
MKPLPYFKSDYCIKGFFGEHRWLSNMYEAKIGGLFVRGGITEQGEFPSVENYYQRKKALWAKADNSIIKAFESCSPYEAKNLGSKLDMSEGQMANWKMNRAKVMYDALRLKFEQPHDLRQKLIDTRGKYLEESNYWGDTFWGRAYKKSDSGLRSQLGDFWLDLGGSNVLGSMLMMLRESYYIRGEGALL